MKRIARLSFLLAALLGDPAFADWPQWGGPARDFAQANFIHADGKLSLLDEQGTLGLANLTPEGLNVLATASVLEEKAWTAPSLIGTKLYLRDRKQIMALELR